MTPKLHQKVGSESGTSEVAKAMLVPDAGMGELFDKATASVDPGAADDDPGAAELDLANDGPDPAEIEKASR